MDQQAEHGAFPCKEAPSSTSSRVCMMEVNESSFTDFVLVVHCSINLQQVIESITRVGQVLQNEFVSARLNNEKAIGKKIAQDTGVFAYC